MSIFTKIIPNVGIVITTLLFTNHPVDDFVLNYWVFQLAIIIIVFWLYYALMESLSVRGTVGKRVTGLKVVNKGREAISFGNASARFFLQLASLCLLGMGHLFALFTKEKRSVHDILSKTKVVKR